MSVIRMDIRLFVEWGSKDVKAYVKDKDGSGWSPADWLHTDVHDDHTVSISMTLADD